MVWNSSGASADLASCLFWKVTKVKKNLLAVDWHRCDLSKSLKLKLKLPKFHCVKPIINTSLRNIPLKFLKKIIRLLAVNLLDLERISLWNQIKFFIDLRFEQYLHIGIDWLTVSCLIQLILVLDHWVNHKV